MLSLLNGLDHPESLIDVPDIVISPIFDVPLSALAV